MGKVISYLMNGVNHLCHSDRTDKTVCVGGRDWQLDVWCRMGILKEPTNQALAEAMLEAGVRPKKHINNK